LKASIPGFFKLDKRSRDKRYRENLYVFFSCIGISIFIWFSIKMSQEYVTDIDYPIQFTNLPKNKVLSQSETDKISLRTKSKGFDLLSLKYLTYKKPVRFNLSNVRLGSDFDNHMNYLLSRNMLQQIIGQMDPDYQLLAIKPDTLFFRLEEVITVDAKVIPDMDITFRQQYMLYDSARINPSHITITGPASMIDTIYEITTEKKTISNLGKSSSFSIGINKPFVSSLVSYNHEEVEISLNVEKYTEATLEVPIEIISDNPEIKLKTFPDRITITYLVALKDFSRVDENTFIASTQYLQSTTGGDNKLNISISQSPSFIRITKFYPEQVEYIIMK
jgi:hypothetical protein